MPRNLLDLANDRVVILDGGMGTSLHKFRPTDADWGFNDAGKSLLNLSDSLVYTHPDWIRDIHAGYFAAGCDAVETNTFNANGVGLGEFGMAHKLDDINRANIKIAREVANSFATSDRPRYVIGSVGPGTKMPSIDDPAISIDFDTLAEAYRPQIAVMLDEGVDAILIETCFDILQAKIVTIVAVEEMKKRGVKVPLMVQVTIMQADQKMLPGTDIAGALTTLECFDEIDVIGMNCAVGPDLMISSLKHLAQYSPKLISVLPNAGLPETRNDEAYFPLEPAGLADWLDRFVRDFGVNIVGGCCGTTAVHLKAVCDRLHGRKPAKRTPIRVAAVSSLLGTTETVIDNRPLLVGERTNTNGSRKFKELLEKHDWNGLTEMARAQEREGVHLLDVCVDYVGRDGVADMKEVIRRYNAVLQKPIMIDSTEVNVVEAALKLCSGKTVINSINLEDGRKTLDPKTILAKKYGAALVALTIDEVGQADTAQWKFEVAERIYKIVVDEYKIPPTDLMFDPLTFPLSTGQEQTRKSAMATFDSIRLIKKHLPGALTHLGLSNCSFGLLPYTRQVLNSVYLHYAVEAGLDSAILHAAKIMPLASIDAEGKELCRRLLFDERVFNAAGDCIEDPLVMLIEHYADAKSTASKTESLGETVEERLRQAIIQGRRETLVADLDLARDTYTPIDIINKILLAGMKVVGDLFGAGQMQLPFVLQSAEVMKISVAHLQQFMTKADGQEKGKIVLATVKGDVHDIGKNLVDIILTNNGYKVYNLGIKQPVENMITELQKTGADAIGMSGLLVKSTVIMKEDLITMNERGLNPPVILGGAALNRRYVEQDLRAIYKGQLFYGEDAFEGLRVMDKLAADKRLASVSPSIRKAQEGASAARQAEAIDRAAAKVSPNGNGHPDAFAGEGLRTSASTVRSKGLPHAPDLPTPPFIGSKVYTDFDVAEVFEYINERTLFSSQWQFTKAKMKPAEYEKLMRDTAIPTLKRLKTQCLAEGILQPAAVCGYYPAASEGNSIVVYAADRTTELHRFAFPRQDFADNLCLADYLEPAPAGRAVDCIGLFAVTAGQAVSEATKRLYDGGQFTDYLYLHGLGVEFAEALAECFHRRMRADWGTPDSPDVPVNKLFKGHYRGRRYAFGYPACPNLEDQAGLFALIDPARIGVTLTEQFLLEPEQSTTAIVFHHPAAKYFNVNRSAEVVGSAE